MAAHFITYRPNRDRKRPELLDRYGDFISWKEAGCIEGWSARKTFQPGDLAIFYMASPMNALVALGIVDTEPYYEEISDPADFKNPVFCDFSPVWFLNHHVPIKAAVKRQHLEAWWRTQPYLSIRRVDLPIAQALVQEVITVNPDLEKKLTKLGWKIPDIIGDSPAPPSTRSRLPKSPKKRWKIEDLLKLSWLEFEHLVGELFAHQHKGAKVEVTAPRGDYGVDVVVISKSRPEIVVVQCKRYRPRVKVSGPDMQKFVGGMAKYKAEKGYFITTSGFNRYAIDFAEGLNVELIDGKKLVQMMTALKDFPSPSEFAKRIEINS